MNKKAIEAAARAVEDTYDVSERGELLNHDDVAHVAVSAYLAEVWRPFDVDKPETHPSGGYSPSGALWLVVREGVAHTGEQFIDNIRWDGGGLDCLASIRWGRLRVKKYIDPSKLIP